MVNPRTCGSCGDTMRVLSLGPSRRKWDASVCMHSVCGLCEGVAGDLNALTVPWNLTSVSTGNTVVLFIVETCGIQPWPREQVDEIPKSITHKNGVVRPDNQPHPLREQQGKPRDPHEQCLTQPSQVDVLYFAPSDGTDFTRHTSTVSSTLSTKFTKLKENHVFINNSGTAVGTFTAAQSRCGYPWVSFTPALCISSFRYNHTACQNVLRAIMFSQLSAERYVLLC
ncbi:hypothetical protein B0H13DRAFT_1989553, partial [Mycena leptocephala]